MTRARFLASAAGAAAAFAGAAAWLFPYHSLNLESPELRWRTWLLTLWTGGVLAVCFGAAGLLGRAAPLGFRDVAQAGSLGDALRERHFLRREGSEGANFAEWLLLVGAGLLGLYFAAWLLRSGA